VTTAVLVLAVAAALFFIWAPAGASWVVLLLLGVSVVTALIMHSRGGAAADAGWRPDSPHRGYNMSRVQVAGFPGLVLVAGFVWMFCTGLPGIAPVVGVFAGLGVMAAGVLLVVRKRQKHLPVNPLRDAGRRS